MKIKRVSNAKKGKAIARAEAGGESMSAIGRDYGVAGVTVKYWVANKDKIMAERADKVDQVIKTSIKNAGKKAIAIKDATTILSSDDKRKRNLLIKLLSHDLNLDY